MHVVIGIQDGTCVDEEWRRMALSAACAAEAQRMMSPGGLPGLTPTLRSPAAAPLGAPLLLSPRLPVPATTAAAPLMSPPEAAAHHQLIYTPYAAAAAAAAAAADYTNYAALAGTPLISDYTAADHSGALFAR